MLWPSELLAEFLNVTKSMIYVSIWPSKLLLSNTLMSWMLELSIPNMSFIFYFSTDSDTYCVFCCSSILVELSVGTIRLAVEMFGNLLLDLN